MNASSLMLQFRAMSAARDQNSTVADSSRGFSVAQLQLLNSGRSTERLVSANLQGVASPGRRIFSPQDMAVDIQLLDADDMLPHVRRGSDRHASPEAQSRSSSQFAPTGMRWAQQQQPAFIDEDCFVREKARPSSSSRAIGGGSGSSSPAALRPSGVGPHGGGHAPGALSDFHGIAVPVPAAVANGQVQAYPSELASQQAIPMRRLVPLQPHVPAEALSDLQGFTAVIARSRGVTDVAWPPPPAVVMSFAAVVRRGSYLIKYSRVDAPHERFLTVLLAQQPFRGGSSANPTQALLACSLHANSTSPDATHNLAMLTGVMRGTSEPPFMRFVDKCDPNWIAGPIVKGSSRAMLPSRLAFAAVFGQASVCLLAASEAIYDGWVTVLEYFAAIGQ
jgi:hypothetical protein